MSTVAAGSTRRIAAHAITQVNVSWAGGVTPTWWAPLERPIDAPSSGAASIDPLGVLTRLDGTYEYGGTLFNGSWTPSDGCALTLVLTLVTWEMSLMTSFSPSRPNTFTYTFEPSA